LAQILIRQLDARVVEILRAQAKRRGVSLEQSLRDLLTSVAAEQDDRLERLAACDDRPRRQDGNWMWSI
jgi:plasmid stability protein